MEKRLQPLTKFLKRSKKTIFHIIVNLKKKRLQPLIKFLKRSKKTIFLIVIFTSVTILLSTAISIWLYKPITETVYHVFHQNLPSVVTSVVTIKTIGVKAYWDPNLTNETTTIQWPTAYPGTTNNITLYLQSASNVNTTLELQTTNWVFLNSNGSIVLGPSNSMNYMNLTWDYNNATLAPNQRVGVTLTLSIDNSNSFVEFLINNSVTQFSFDITISANESSQP